MIEDKLSQFSEEDVELGWKVAYALWSKGINCHGISVKESLGELLAFRRKNYLQLTLEHTQTAVKCHNEGDEKGMKFAVIRATKCLKKHQELKEKFVGISDTG